MIIGIDLDQDLWMAGYERSEAQSFENAWMEALERVTRAIGIDVSVSSELGKATETLLPSGDIAETIIWQAAHDMLSRRDDGTWLADTVSEMTEMSLRRRLGIPVEVDSWQE